MRQKRRKIPNVYQEMTRVMNTIRLDSPTDCIDNNGFAQFSFHNVDYYSHSHEISMFAHDIELYVTVECESLCG